MDDRQPIKEREMAKIKVYTTEACADCRHAKRFLKEHGIAFDEINIEANESAAEFVMLANAGKRKVPTFEVDGHTFNLSPFDAKKLRTQLGLA